MKGVGAAAVVLNGKGEVLLVKHTYGVCNWELPGGGGEVNESPSDTAIREVREETGLVVEPVATTGWYYEPLRDALHVAVLCKVVGETAEPEPDNREISACRYWPTSALPRPLSDFTELRIAHAISGSSGPLPTVIGPRQWRE